MNGFPLFQPKAPINEPLVGVEVCSAQFGSVHGLRCFNASISSS